MQGFWWTESEQLLNAVQQFNKKIHEDLLPDSGNYVVSGLGMWLLFAVGIGVNSNQLTKEQQEAAEALLGMPAADASLLASKLLNDAPEALKTATGAWYDDTLTSTDPVTSEWVKKIIAHPAVDVENRIPSQSELDSWADHATEGLIPTFPLSVEEGLPILLILANALTVKIAWKTAFGTIENKTGYWNAKELLHSPAEEHSKTFFTEEETGETFFALTNHGDNITVTAIVPLNKTLPDSEVVAVAEKWVTRKGLFVNTDTATLPIDSDLYNVTEIKGFADRYDAALPAWSAENNHNFNDSSTLQAGLKLVGNAAASPEANIEFEGAQSAKAVYTKEKFEAAAVSALSMRAGSVRMPSACRDFKIVVDRPFAVVAYSSGQKNPAWYNVPLFTSFVRTSDEA